MTEPRMNSLQRDRWLAPSTSWVAFSARAKPTSASRDVGAADLVVLAAELGEQPAMLGEPLGRRPGEAVGRADVHAEELAARRASPSAPRAGSRRRRPARR